jgi:hypothetical protein
VSERARGAVGGPLGESFWHAVTSWWPALYVLVKTTTPHQAPFINTSLRLGLAAALVAAGLSGCDAPDDPSDRALELEDEDLPDEELDELVAEEADEVEAEDDEVEAEVDTPAVTETVADVLAQLPEALQVELSPEELDRPVEIAPLKVAVDVDGNGVLDQMDDFATVTDPVAINEIACATQALTDPVDGATVAMTAAPNCGYAYDGSTSPNTSYDTAACPHQYVTEVTGTSGEPLSFYWQWHGANLDQTLCGTAHASLSTYGAYITLWPFAVSWVKLGTTSVHGVWYDTAWFDYCGWEYDAGKGPIPSLGNHIYFKVRTAAQATGFIFKQPVEGGVMHGNGPC